MLFQVRINYYNCTLFIFVKADFPKKKAHQLSDILQKQNNGLAASYNNDGNFPLVVMLDKFGKVL